VKHIFHLQPNFQHSVKVDKLFFIRIHGTLGAHHKRIVNVWPLAFYGEEFFNIHKGLVFNTLHLAALCGVIAEEDAEGKP